jgi:TolB-like protein
MIEPCNRPIMFELKHTAELAHWKGDASDPVWKSFLGDVRQLMKNEGVRPSPAIVPPAVQKRRFGVAAIVGVVAVLLAIAGMFWLAGRSPNAARKPAQSVAAASSGTPAEAMEVTLAVLPFADMSQTHDQEYYSDGLSEEILNQLAQIKDLAVTGRTSSFSFKGKNEDLRSIAKQLGVANILEGSIRKDGSQLRITAQLINGKSGTRLWSQTYERESKDVFAVQEEIAKDVARALSIKLDVGDLPRAQGGTTNLDAYDKYLRAQPFWRADGPEAQVQAARLYREAVAIDPGFSRAWLGLFQALRNELAWAIGDAGSIRKEMAEASARVEALSPDAWWTKVMQSDRLLAQRNWLESEAAYNAAMAAAPASEVGCGRGVFLLGDVRATLPCVEHLRQADPLNLAISVTLQEQYDMSDRPTEAQAEYERSKALDGDHGRADHWALFRLMANKDATRAAIRAQFREFMRHEDSIHLQINHEIFEKLDDKAAVLAALRKASEDPGNQDTNAMFVIALYADRFGDKDLALTALSRYRIDLGLNPRFLWVHFVTSLRADPRFKEILRKQGLVDYFRASGKWGDYCKPVGKDDFECH